jgi:hypothetical protein
MKSIQIKDSYKIWRPSKMKHLIKIACMAKYCDPFANEVLHRSYVDMYCEWWWHNIGYYLTRHIPLFESINERCKDVDLEEHYG